jgi:hypothetical protein
MKFISLKKSNIKNKKLVLKLSEPNKTIHFGWKGSLTYTNGATEEQRTNYLKRHKVNEDWTSVNPGSASAFILWGKSRDIQTNLDSYLRKFDIQK